MGKKRATTVLCSSKHEDYRYRAAQHNTVRTEEVACPQLAHFLFALVLTVDRHATMSLRDDKERIARGALSADVRIGQEGRRDHRVQELLLVHRTQRAKQWYRVQHISSDYFAIFGL